MVGEGFVDKRELNLQYNNLQSGRWLGSYSEKYQCGESAKSLQVAGFLFVSA